MSAFPHVLRLSGLLGFAAGFSVSLYRFILEDRILYGGVQVAPDWVEPVTLMLLFGSLAVFIYASMLDAIFEEWVDIVVGAAITAQWGLPVTIYLAADGPLIAGIGSIISSILHMVVAVAFIVNYGRRMWPKFT